MNKKVLSLFIVVLMVLAVIPVFLPSTQARIMVSQPMENISTTLTPHPVPSANTPPLVVKYLNQLYHQAFTKGKGTVRLIVAPRRGYEEKVLSELRKMGKIDPISRPEYDFIVVTLPVKYLPLLKNMPGIARVWEDKTIKLPNPVMPEKAPEISNKPLQEGGGGYDPFAWDMYAINAPQARESYNVSGSNALIAIVDTGADVAQPYLQITPDGRRKIIYWIDETGEGTVDLAHTFNSTQVSDGTVSLTLYNVTLDWGPYYMYVMRSAEFTKIPKLDITISFSSINVTNGTYRFGFLPERYFDINFDHNYDEIYFVLVTPEGSVYFYPIPLQLNTTDANTLHAIINGTLNTTVLKDMMTIPSGVNYTYTVNLSNAYYITPFAQSGDYIMLGPGTVNSTTYVTFDLGQPGTTKVANGTVYNSIVLCTVGTNSVTFGWDGGQHGTHVSGTAAGYGKPGSYFAGLEGVAPSAQLIEFKSLSSIGYGRTSWIIAGMIDAALSGADVISMSLGGLWSGYNDGIESPDNYYANLLTELFGVTFAIAAGNDGPSTNTVGSPGDADLVITVGNYWSTESWGFWYGVPNVTSGPAMSSSRGPRLDGMIKPDVMAPGSFIFSSLPIWAMGYYGTWASDFWDGTSMATPHVSGAVALLVDYAKTHNLTYDPFIIKRAIELSAEPVDGATPIDQGAGLINIDKAIQELIKLSKEKTTYIYAGTTFGPYKNPIGEKELPLFANILFNGWFQEQHKFPYLYRGVYLRNERPVTVPIYIYGTVYDKEHGTLLPVNDTYKISTSASWLKVSTNEVSAKLLMANFTLTGISYTDFYSTTGIVYVTVDYSQLQAPGTYIGYVYIDDPSTSYIDGRVPVVVTVPLNKDDTSSAHLSDVEYPGQAKHYYVDVPAGTSVLKVTLSVPVDANGHYMGRAKPVISDPRGNIVATTGSSVGFYYVGPGGPESYTWVIPNPTPGTWEITIYSSTFSAYFTGYAQSHYNLDVKLEGISPSPASIYQDFTEPGNYSVSVAYKNTMGDVSVKSFGYGLGSLESAVGYQLQINQSQWLIVDVVNATPAQKLYYFKVGITAPENKSADLDLYVLYYTTWDALMADLSRGILGLNATKIYLDQIGPTSYESFDLFMPAHGYYLVVVNGYDVPKVNMGFIYYRQILRDNGQVGTDETPFTLVSGESKHVGYSITLNGVGTYLGVVGLQEAESGAALTYVPMILQVGKPKMYVALMGTPTLGKPSLMTLKILDKATMEPIQGESIVYINGKEYIADNGELKFYYTALNFTETLDVKVIDADYTDYSGEFIVKAQDLASNKVSSADQMKPVIAKGQAEILEYNVSDTQLTVEVNGTHGETATLVFALPSDTQSINVQGSHVISWYTEKGNNAVYVIVTVRFASSATVTVKYQTRRWIINNLNLIFYMKYLGRKQLFDKLYEEALAANVSNTTIQEALKYRDKAVSLYEKVALRGIFSDTKAFVYLRQAYLDMDKACRILEKALKG